ncbi:MAG: ATP-binding cassette domain-containing protein [Nitratireductor sp.]|nr:oligopeptide/dipeptide ABC transporter ATP-binding protein [Nitratireductor sp.]MCV0378357.1 ATP-binding cassette domain-containing protein [Nitratireductor sp.]
MTNKEPLLEVRNLEKHFPVRRGILRRTQGYVKAVDGVSLTLDRGETLGLVGESGCGKTTAGRSILRLISPSRGDILFSSRSLSGEGEETRRVNVATVSREELRQLRRDMQIIFQDPYSSLDPRMSVADLVGEPLYVHGIAKGAELRDRVEQLLVAVGLNADHMQRYSHEFSGGQRQRIGIARALALRPQMIVADEPISALDVSIQAQVVTLLQDLQEEFDLTYLIVTHDLTVVRYLCDRVAVMYLGQIVEIATAEALFADPLHPYTEALLSAVPLPDPAMRIEQIVLEGDVPSPLNPPSGCRFHPRCRYAQDICKKEVPEFRDMSEGRSVACHFADTLDLRPFGRSS